MRLWQYDESAHKKFIDAVVSGEADTEKQVHIIAEELANRSSVDKKSKKLLTLSVEAVILERMGLSAENATRQPLFVPALLNETQATENNPLLDKLDVIQTQESETKSKEESV